MANRPSFAAMASSFLTRPHQPMNTSTTSTSQPVFFSFITDDSEGHIGRSHYPHDDSDGEDPQLLGGSHRQENDSDDDENPYLRLDEADEAPSSGKGKARESIPLIMEESSASRRSVGGWLAHGMASPSPSPPSTSSSPRSNSDEPFPPPDLLVSPSHRNQSNRLSHSSHTPRQTIAVDSSQLTESLLPSHQSGRDEFYLPDPSSFPSRGRRKYHDSVWTTAFLFAISSVYISALLVLILVKKPKDPANGANGSWHTPYNTLLHTVPLLTILTFATAIGAYLHVFLLSQFVGIVMWATELITPVLLLVSSLWAFIGSFMWEDGVTPTWGETVGLRLFSIIPLIMAIYTARNLFSLSFISDTKSFSLDTGNSRRRNARRRRGGDTDHPPSMGRRFTPQIKFSLPSRIRKTSKTLTLTTKVMLNNPFLMLLSPALLVGVGVASLPFAVVAFRLLLIGQFTHRSSQDDSWDFHLKPLVPPLLVLTVLLWLWGIMAARGVMRVASGACTGTWVHADPAIIPPVPFSTPSLLQSRATLQASLFRATQPSLGTVCLAALLLSLARLLTYTALFIERLPVWTRPLLGGVGRTLPVLKEARILVFFGGILAWVGRWLIGWIERRTNALSRYALIYTGLTGAAFWPSVQRAADLTSSASETPKASPPHLPLSLTPLLLPLPNALGTYLFVAHTLKSPAEAFGNALVAAGVTYIVASWAVGGIWDIADTLYLCYCIDTDKGAGKMREEIQDAFEHDHTPNEQRQPPPPEDEFDHPILPTHLAKNLPSARTTGGNDKRDSVSQGPPIPPLPTPSHAVYTPSVELPKQPLGGQSPGVSEVPLVEDADGDIDPFNVAGTSRLEESAVTHHGASKSMSGDGSDIFPGSGFF